MTSARIDRVTTRAAGVLPRAQLLDNRRSPRAVGLIHAQRRLTDLDSSDVAIIVSGDRPALLLFVATTAAAAVRARPSASMPPRRERAGPLPVP